MEEKTERRPQRKRIPVVAKYLAGSPLGIRGTLKRPQVPPKAEKPKPEPKIELPRCPHGLLLTREEFEFQSQHPLVDEAGQPIPLTSSICTQCFPYCKHAEKELTPQEIASGKRYSATCLECNPGVSRNPKVYASWLKEHGLSVGRGMSIAKLVINNPDGTAHIIGSGANLCTGGGSNDMERTDASSIGRSDVPAQGSNWQQSSSDTYCDEQVRVEPEIDEQVHVEPQNVLASNPDDLKEEYDGSPEPECTN